MNRGIDVSEAGFLAVGATEVKPILFSPHRGLSLIRYARDASRFKPRRQAFDYLQSDWSTTMRTFLTGLITVVSLTLLVNTLFGDEVALDKLPKAVADSLKAKFPGCEITKALSETENDKLVYEVSLKHKSTNYDIIVTPEGKINVVEKAIDAKSLPKPVVDALEKKYPKAKINLAEELSDGSGKITAYEVHCTAADGKKVAIEFEPDGKIVSEE